MKRTQKPVIAITSGDHNGIGPEVALKCVMMPAIRRICVPVLVGPLEVFAFYAKRVHIPIQFAIIDDPMVRIHDRAVAVLPPSTNIPCNIKPGTLSATAGMHAASAIRMACNLAMRKQLHAIVTGPVNKNALHKAGVDFDGQTEFLQHLTRSARVTMMLVSHTMRVGLATIHVPLSAVAKRLTKQTLRNTLETVSSSLRQDWRIAKPRLAVLGLNPHAGEHGDIGNEEQTIIIPVVNELRKRRMLIEGPFSADGFFGTYQPASFDAVIAMYHDQGLIPLKMSSFGSAVNYSAGLPIIRTSPDHGTAFDIAGKGLADPGSMVAAIKLAVMIANNRKNTIG